MLVVADRTRTGLEDTLRSLGAVLDAHRARSVYIREVEAGLLVRAQAEGTLESRIDGVAQPLERLFTTESLEEERAAAVARRGTGHVAGPIERGLRLVGHRAAESGFTGLTLIQHHTDDGWLVWHDGSTGGPQLFSLTNSELSTLDAQFRARAGRQAPPTASEI
jgi:hypothetical protein